MAKGTIVRGQRQTMRRRVGNKFWNAATPDRAQTAARNAGTSRETFTDSLWQALTPDRAQTAAREGSGRHSAVARSQTDALREVLREERDQAKQKSGSQTSESSKTGETGEDTPSRPSSVKATWHRLKLQAVPHIVTAATGVAGLSAWAVAAATGDPRLVAGWLGVIAVPTATGAAWIVTTWRRKNPDTGEKHPMWLREWRARAVTLAVVASLWITGAALWGVSAPYAALLLAAVFTVAARWWQAHRPGYEPAAEPVTVEPGDRRDRNQIEWTEHVGHPKGPLPGSTLTEPTPLKYGTAYTLLLARGGQGGTQQTLKTAVQAQTQIAAALDWGVQDITIETHPTSRSAARARVVILDTNPIEGKIMWQGPAVDGGSLLLGPYADGMGEAPYVLYNEGHWVGGTDGDDGGGEVLPPGYEHGVPAKWKPGGMWSGVLIGGTGIGKSRVIEGIAISAMSRGDTVVWFLDPQDGASSHALKNHASRFAGKADTEHMLAAIEAVVAYRQAENAELGLTGFTPTPERPGLLVIIDECHEVFWDSKMGDRWGNIVRKARKVGVSLLTASQYAGVKTFGHSEPLRSSIMEGNAIAMRVTSKQGGQLMAGLDVDPLTLPKIEGYGYTQDTGNGRTAPFRNRLCNHPAEWMESMPAVALDDGSATAAGEARAGDKPMGEPQQEHSSAGGARVIPMPNLADYSHRPEPDTGTSSDTVDSRVSDDGSSRPDGSKGEVYTAVAAGAASPKEVQQMVGLGKVRTAALLRELVDDGQLHQPKHGQYALVE